jgi:hypothetical protein
LAGNARLRTAPEPDSIEGGTDPGAALVISAQRRIW